jgi:GTP-sensing pleiotropic transcriptional regulator CodY
MNQATELQSLNLKLTTQTMNATQLDSLYHTQYLKQLENVSALQMQLDSVKDELEAEQEEVGKLQSTCSALTDKGKEWELILMRKEKTLKDTKTLLADIETNLADKQEQIKLLDS